MTLPTSSEGAQRRRIQSGHPVLAIFKYNRMDTKILVSIAPMRLLATVRSLYMVPISGFFETDTIYAVSNTR